MGFRMWDKFKRKAFRVRTVEGILEAHQGRNSGGEELRRVLGPLDLLMFGVGMIIGAGVFVLTGTAARDEAGPAVVVSYGVASVAAMLSALCYAEFAAEVPVAGSAFNYVGMVYGEFMGWIAAINLIAEYSLAASTVAKGFSGYFASLCNWETHALTIALNKVISVDLLSLFLILMLALLLVKGIKESSVMQNIISAINVVTILVVLGSSLPFFKAENLSPFVPEEFGYRGIFHAASIVFFSYLGFDGVATAAEEVKNAKRDLPLGIVGSILICTVLFIGMSLGIVGMKKYTEIDPNAPFSVALQQEGLSWVSSVVSIGALTGIVTSLMMCLYAMARIFMVLGREGFLPHALAKVNERTQTPINATVLTVVLAALPAMFLNMNILAVMVSMGSLAVMSLVCAGVITKTYRPGPKSECSSVPHDVLLATIFVSAIAEGLLFERQAPMWAILASLGVWLLATVGFAFLPSETRSDTFAVPLKPFLPSMGVLVTVHLLCSLQWPAYVRFIVWQALGVLVYVFYSMHHSQEHGDSTQKLLVKDPADCPPIL